MYSALFLVLLISCGAPPAPPVRTVAEKQAAPARPENVVEKVAAYWRRDVNALDEAGEAPLTAIARGDAEAVALLVQHPSIDLNLVSSHGHTPLSSALARGDAAGHAIAQTLLQAGAVVNGTGLLHQAVLRQDLAALRLLLAQGSIHPNERDAHDHTPLM